jgi:hypothetical protein
LFLWLGAGTGAAHRRAQIGLGGSFLGARHAARRRRGGGRSAAARMVTGDPVRGTSLGAQLWRVVEGKLTVPDTEPGARLAAREGLSWMQFAFPHPAAPMTWRSLFATDRLLYFTG